MIKFTVFLLASFLTVGCSKVSDYVAGVIPGLIEETELEKVDPGLCPADKPKALVVQGVCTGNWSHSYDATSKVYTCTYTQKAAVYCPPGSVVIGQPSGCGGEVEQYTKKTVTSDAACNDLFLSEVRVAYRLVCCI